MAADIKKEKDVATIQRGKWMDPCHRNYSNWKYTLWYENTKDNPVSSLSCTFNNEHGNNEGINE